MKGWVNQMNEKESIELLIENYVEMIVDDINSTKKDKSDLFESGKRLGLISALKTLKTSLISYDPDLAEKILDYDLDKEYL